MLQCTLCKVCRKQLHKWESVVSRVVCGTQSMAETSVSVHALACVCVCAHVLESDGQ